MECYHFKIYLIKKYIFIYLKLYKFINLKFYVKYTLNHYNSLPLIKKSLVELDKYKEKKLKIQECSISGIVINILQ